MARHLDRLLQRLRVEVLAHGNIAEGEAVALGPAIASALSHPEPLSEEELPTRHAHRMPDGGRRGVGGGGDGGGVVVDLEAATEEEKNSAVQVCACRLPGTLGGMGLKILCESAFFIRCSFVRSFGCLQRRM